MDINSKIFLGSQNNWLRSKKGNGRYTKKNNKSAPHPIKLIQYDENSEYDVSNQTVKKRKVKIKPRKLSQKNSCQKLSSSFCRIECVKAFKTGCSVFSCSRKKKQPNCLGWGKNSIRNHSYSITILFL